MSDTSSEQQLRLPEEKEKEEDVDDERKLTFVASKLPATSITMTAATCCQQTIKAASVEHSINKIIDNNDDNNDDNNNDNNNDKNKRKEKVKFSESFNKNFNTNRPIPPPPPLPLPLPLPLSIALNKEPQQRLQTLCPASVSSTIAATSATSATSTMHAKPSSVILSSKRFIKSLDRELLNVNRTIKKLSGNLEGGTMKSPTALKRSTDHINESEKLSELMLMRKAEGTHQGHPIDIQSRNTDANSSSLSPTSVTSIISDTAPAKMNLNIILTQSEPSIHNYQHNYHYHDHEQDIDDDLSVISENKIETKSNKKLQAGSFSSTITATATATTSVTANAQQKRLLWQNATAMTRQHLRNATTIMNNNNNNNNLQVQVQAARPSSAIISSMVTSQMQPLTLQKRPPQLQRAMSAPCHHHQTQYSMQQNEKKIFVQRQIQIQNQNQNQRKYQRRNRKCLPNRQLTYDDATTAEDEDKSKNRKGKLLNRSRSVAPETVVTLVSLLSSEDGSDTEKEEHHHYTDSDNITTVNGNNNNNNGNDLRRAPTLSKTGKSVSFQEHYGQLNKLQLANSRVRRGSRPSFITEHFNSQRPSSALTTSSTKSTISAKLIIDANGRRSPLNKNIEQEQQSNDSNDIKLTSISNKFVLKSIEKNEIQYPDYVLSIKERECWKLFKIMLSKGVHITYETILRGMLTPTEFRQFQKQRQLEESKEI